MNIGSKKQSRQSNKIVLSQNEVKYEHPPVQQQQHQRDTSFGPPVSNNGESHNFSVVDYHESSNLISQIEEKGQGNQVHNSTKQAQRHDPTYFESSKSLKKLLERPPLK